MTLWKGQNYRVSKKISDLGMGERRGIGVENGEIKAVLYAVVLVVA